MPSKPNWKGSTGELPPPPVRIVMDSSDMLEEMFRGDTYSLSPTSLSRRASYVAPTIASSRSLSSEKPVSGGNAPGLLGVGGMGSGGGLSLSSGGSSRIPSAHALHPFPQPPANILLPDHSYLFSNRVRREALQEFVDAIFQPTNQSSAPENAFKKSKKRPTSPNPHAPSQNATSTVIESAFTLGRWSIERFNHIIKLIREPLRTRPSISPSLVYDLDSLHWAALSKRNSDEGTDNAQADEEVWKRYAVDILKKPLTGPGSLENSTNPDTAPPSPIASTIPDKRLPKPLSSLRNETTEEETSIDMDEIRRGAYTHFRNSILTTLEEISDQELCTVVCFITRYGTAPQMMSIVFPVAIRRISEITLMRDIIPRFVVLAVLQPDVEGAAMVEMLLSLAMEMITIDTANSALEYCAHLQRTSCCKLVLDRVGWLVRPEGVVSAMIPAAARGSEHILALLELFVMDRIQGEGGAKGFAKPAIWGVGKSGDCGEGGWDSGVGGGGGGGPMDYGELVAPCSYALLVLAAAAGYAKPSTVKELLEFYEDPCSVALCGRVSEGRHRRFVKELFTLTCQLNHVGITWVLIEAQWMPPSIQSALYQAVKLGHQSIVHILLDSLLLPDSQIDTHSGVVPILFRNSEVLALLPMVARRFPTEASWFLEQISCIPIPACVPRTNHHEADLRPRIVRGVRLGSVSLLEAIQRFATLTSAQSMWSRVSMNGQFHRAGLTATGASEAECLICMAPAALLDQEAIHDTVGGRVFRSSNPFIRLLATGDESITLQPCMQALMEYHWIRGKFWLRYALQFSMSLAFIIGIFFVFVLIIQKQYAAALTTVNSPIYESQALIPLSVLVVVLSFTFLIQELRQFLDEPSEYVSPSNAADLTIHIASIYSIVRAVFLSSYVPPLLLSATIVLAACRLLLHLRIIPSVGPIIRIWASATLNILPILFPMMIMALSFAAAFYLMEMSIVDTSVVYQGHFHGMQESLQSVLTMMGGDYSVLDNAGNPSIFALRLLFHVIFIIFLVNLIIALLTINVAEIQVNTNAAWLTEIGELMVELELYWPYPMRYKVRSSALMGGGVGAGGRKGSKGSTVKGGGGGVPGSVAPRRWWRRDDIRTVLLTESVVLYSCPDETVAASRWYRTESGDHIFKKITRGGADQPRLLRAETNGGALGKGRWNILATALRLGRSNTQGAISTNTSAALPPSASGGMAGLVAGVVGGQGEIGVGPRQNSASRILTAQGKKEDEDTPAPLTDTTSAIGLDLKIVDEVERIIDTEEYSGMSTESSQALNPGAFGAAALETLQERRVSRWTDQPDMIKARVAAGGDGDGPGVVRATPQGSVDAGIMSSNYSPFQHREIIDHVQGLRNMIVALDRGARVEARQARERMLRLEDGQDQERRMTAEALASMQVDLRNLHDDVRALLKVLTPASEDVEQGEGFLQRLFGSGGGRRRSAGTFGNKSKTHFGA
ncbi:hypothetical protein HDV00_007955 [Rhizophlyctis rosea]|nr:hypothetical protein HDV00_007955 [Rhizophlyctis rosea]